MQRMMLAAVQATDKRLIALQYLMRISGHLAFPSPAQKDDSHCGPSLDCRAGVITPLTSVVPVSRARRAVCGQAHGLIYSISGCVTRALSSLMFINDATVTST